MTLMILILALSSQYGHAFSSSSVTMTRNVANVSSCECALTSGNKASCCAHKNGAGENTGDFCGSWFDDYHCGGDTPLCCTSDNGSACCKHGATCAPACAFGLAGCGCIDAPPPSNVSAQYDEKTARAFAALTGANSCGPVEGLKNWTCEACRAVGFDLAPGSMRFIARDELGRNTTFAYVAGLQKQAGASTQGPAPAGSCVVSIRGTKNLDNGLLDAAFWETDPVAVGACDGCTVHAGFHHAWSLLESGVIRALEGAGCGAGGVYVTGHSMGASMAHLAMYALHSKGYTVHMSYNFEAARVGNAPFVAAFEAKFGRPIAAFRISHARDPVPHLPPQGVPMFEYKHAGPEVYYQPSHNADDHVVCHTGEDVLCADRYSLADTLSFGSDHCSSPLIVGGNICNCPF